tara:strand:- start:823 stop:1515 length:693 start_codon:yes stop_codon:yes gene_type:complete
MENLSKETLITIINDLNEKLNKAGDVKEKTEPCENLEDQKKEIKNLHKQLQASKSDGDKYREKYREMIERYRELQKDFKDMNDIYKSRRDDDNSSVSSDEDKKVDNFNMTTEQRCNVLNFIQKFCTWKQGPVPIEDPCGSSFTTIAPESSTTLHQNLRAWAIQQDILTKGKNRAIPDKSSFVKFMNAEQMKRYPQQSFKPQEKWEFPYPYWGTHSSPRYNLKLNKTFIPQ